MAEGVLARKLHLKAGQQALVINAPPGYTRTLGAEVGTELAGRPGASAEFIQVFATSKREVEDLLPAILRVLKHDGLLWVSYPKGTSKTKTDLNRDILWKAMERFGLAGVTMVSIDNAWSAMRFRPLDRVGR